MIVCLWTPFCCYHTDSIMNSADYFSIHKKYLAERGVSFITDIRAEGKGAAIANTYFLKVGDNNYIVDPGCGKKRRQQIREQLPFTSYDMLITHSHLDHIANSGLVAGENSQTIVHPLVAGRIKNLKRNYTEITLEMVNLFGIRGVFGRTGILRPSVIKKLETAQKFFPALIDLALYIGSLYTCRQVVGGIYPPHKNVVYLGYENSQKLMFADTLFKGWSLGEDLFALATPGHQDDHLSFYVPSRGIMFSGDLIIANLNPNDILDGSIKETSAGMLQMLQLAEAGGIDILAVSHDLPVIGKENVISYLCSIIAMQEEVLKIIAAIVAACPDKTDSEAIITRVYAHESEHIKRLLKVNYPRSVSFIDVYVYIYLKEFVWQD